jgi:hypothetical protein
MKSSETGLGPSSPFGADAASPDRASAPRANAETTLPVRTSAGGPPPRQGRRAGLAMSLSAMLRNMNAPIAFWSFVTTGTLT